MPFTIRRRGDGRRPWKIVSKATGRTMATSRTKRDAQASARIRTQGDRR